MTDLSVDAAIRLQEAWRDRVRIPTQRLDPDTATGVDIGYDPASDRLVAAGVAVRRAVQRRRTPPESTEPEPQEVVLR